MYSREPSQMQNQRDAGGEVRTSTRHDEELLDRKWVNVEISAREKMQRRERREARRDQKAALWRVVRGGGSAVRGGGGREGGGAEKFKSPSDINNKVRRRCR